MAQRTEEVSTAGHPGLDLDDDFRFQQRMWAFERAGWLVIGLLLVAAMLGLFGSTGPLSQATAGSSDGPRVQYARFARHGAPLTLEVELPAPATTEARVRLVMSRAYLDGVDLERVIPEPEGVELSEDEYTYVFEVAESGRPLVVTFDLQPQSYWLHRGWVRMPGDEPVRFSQFVYP